jgi:FKBP-type peptidyl-prolyl cis-trans isomerase FkpA
MKKSLIFLLLVFFLACSEDTPDISEDEMIQEFITANGLDAQKTSSGLYVVIDEAGADPFPSSSSEVTVHYSGYFLNGQVFDSSIQRGVPLTISLTSVISGWREGIPYFGTGGEGMLLMPSSLAYGSTGSGSIPPNTPLVFDVELISVN